ncbi:transglycosylase domain-containing protein [Paractinoplanes globisporus]|uniref:Transglycosylase domain-containing protein n=1 Tax=Paractinoplanes globisporus TaxID=113565 RepID=A0ABW6WPB5_9ACTN|nr:transglycosylase domain-containing protein [Actinoplanes globisporus]
MGTAVPGGATGSARVGARASVGAGTSSVGARASVARAAVRPNPGLDAPDGPGGIKGRGKDKSKAAKRRRRTNILTAAAAVVVILLGAGVVGGTYFFDDVALPPPVTEDQSNVIQYSNGSVLAKMGEQNRTVVPEEKINEVVEHAVAAAEDKNFYTHHGIDMKGIVRAAWNNFTGGTTQGASTITQQYARHAADLKAISINRKLREAVIARKLESQYNKDQIMGMYLNYIDLGEGRYGIEAAAQGYFGKSVTTPAGDPKAITPYEAAVLASIIKQPYPNSASQGYDPNYNPSGAKDRWEYTMKNMLEMHWITPEVYAARKYPAVRKPNANSCKTCAADTPAGMILRHVKAELAQMGISDSEFDQGGLTVKTTINPVVQKAAEDAGSAARATSPMHKLPKTYQAAVIGIDPNNGRVLGYYGGDSPTGTDYGGYMSGDGTKILGGQSPGSSFKIYTLAAGLQEDLSFDSIWDSSKLRPNGTPINNAGADPGTICKGKTKDCDLETATIKSYNFPFYWLADAMGRDKVIDAAKAAGLKHMFTDSGKNVDLTKTDKSTWLKSGYFDNEVAFGQYRIVPLEHAEGVATIVNGGVHFPAHFVMQVKRVNPEDGKIEILNPEKNQGNRVFRADTMTNLQGVMKEIVDVDKRDLRSGRESIAKSGTWEYDDGKDSHTGSGDCWFVGGIPQLAATVWVGGKNNKVELHDPASSSRFHDMFGAGVPSRIWKQFLDTVTKNLDWKQEDFPARIKTGEADKFGNGIKPIEPPVDPNTCALSLIGGTCPGDGNNGGGPNGGNNGGGRGNGGGGGGTTTTNDGTTPTQQDIATTPATG